MATGWCELLAAEALPKLAVFAVHMPAYNKPAAELASHFIAVLWEIISIVPRVFFISQHIPGTRAEGGIAASCFARRSRRRNVCSAATRCQSLGQVCRNGLVMLRRGNWQVMAFRHAYRSVCPSPLPVEEALCYHVFLYSDGQAGVRDDHADARTAS